MLCIQNSPVIVWLNPSPPNNHGLYIHQFCVHCGYYQIKEVEKCCSMATDQFKLVSKYSEASMGVDYIVFYFHLWRSNYFFF